jgi:hypothetical protein
MRSQVCYKSAELSIILRPGKSNDNPLSGRYQRILSGGTIPQLYALIKRGRRDISPIGRESDLRYESIKDIRILENELIDWR